MTRKRVALLSLALAAIAVCPSDGVAQRSNGDSPHGTLSESIDCSACHTPTAWKPAKARLDFDHDRSTSFALLGRHAQASCSGCHLDLRFDKPQLSSADCSSCHVDVHRGNFSDDCSSCHGTISFNDIDGRALHSTTGFPLTGSHMQIACESCHMDDQGGAFSSLDISCFSCHEQDYTATSTVDHVASNFPTDCELCHSSLAWVGDATFDHITVSSGFNLTGAHTALACSSCHNEPSMDLLFPAPAGQNDCIACHQTDYDNDHGGSGIPVTCLECHNDSRWEDADFAHVTAGNGFDLIGAHAPLECTSCHNLPGLDLIFPAPAGQNDCIACHQNDYDRDHGGTGFPVDCLQCHTNDTWGGATFDHAAAGNGYDLIGAHAALECISCHNLPGLDLIFPPPAGHNDCVTCHQSDYDGAHTGFPLTCLDCHTNDTWVGAAFDHITSGNGFDLIGAHAALECISCHNLPGFDLIFPPPAGQNDCVTCHQTDYDGAHTGFPLTCLDCHTNDTWVGAAFDHATAANGYDLIGAHTALECISCHNLPGFDLIFPPPTGQNDCVACHQNDYDLQHSGTGFPVTCLDCHTNDTWAGATFDHSAYFPTSSGPHAGTACETCHIDPNNYQVFTCFNCHQHSQDRMDSAHSEVNGYAYDSNACYSCHPDGRKP